MNYSSDSNVSETSSSATASSSMPETTVRTLSVYLPKNVEKDFSVMKFNGELDIDFSKWTKAEMTRENNSKEFKDDTEETPEFGAGSEFGLKEREARRKRFGRNKESYKADDQPWILKSCGDSTKKYKGDREGGVGENAAYYVFTHGDNGTLEAYPVKEWYNFQSVQRFKTLTAEEAEEQYSNRSKCLNLFSVMLKKKMKNGSDDDEDEDSDEGKTKIKKTKDFKVSEMDEQIDSSSEASDEESDDSADKNFKNGKKKSKNANNKKKFKRDTNVEALEDSDDGDGEGRECDYISSDSSESEHEYSLQGVAEEKGLKVILNSDEDDSDDEKEVQQNSEQKPDGSKKDSDFSSDSDTDNNFTTQKSNKEINKKVGKELVAQICENIQNPKPSLKRKQDFIINESDKKPRAECSGRNVPFTEFGITEEAIRKYLTRKPTTLIELISKFKLKNLNNKERKKAEAAITLILRRIKPKQENINKKMYFSL